MDTQCSRRTCWSWCPYCCLLPCCCWRLCCYWRFYYFLCSCCCCCRPCYFRCSCWCCCCCPCCYCCPCRGYILFIWSWLLCCSCVPADSEVPSLVGILACCCWRSCCCCLVYCSLRNRRDSDGKNLNFRLFRVSGIIISRKLANLLATLCIKECPPHSSHKIRPAQLELVKHSSSSIK